MIRMSNGLFALLLQQFFEHLRNTQEVSRHTICSYRDTLRLLVQFLAKAKRISIDRITFDIFNVETILAFLEHLQNQRHNSNRTRNARLAAIRAFVRFLLPHLPPEFIAQIQRILAIPSKRVDKPLLGFLSHQEVNAILMSTNPSTWVGRRDHLLFSLLYNTGARISEALQLTPEDIQNRIARLKGKGRRQREVPLWRETQREIKQWCRANQISSSQPIFGNRHCQPISRRQAARRLKLTIEKASTTCPSLRQRKITLHSWRHTCAMHLLQAGNPIEVIALWLGHEQLSTTHGYLEADLDMKNKILAELKAPRSVRQAKKSAYSHVLAFLEAL
jgi:integrase/recombinase XerD